MGVIIDAEIETSAGPTRELYFRIENWKVNKTTAKIRFTTTAWLEKDFADRFFRKYEDDPFNNSIGIVGTKVVYYEEGDTHGKELNIPNLYEFSMAVEKEVDKPVFETKEISKEVPDISFDEEGEEITLYRTVTEKKTVQVGTEKVLKNVIDYSMVDRLGQVSYEFLIKELKEHFPAKVIKTV
jgi:hypothetical protein